MFEEPVLPRRRVVAVVATFTETKLMRVITQVAGNTIRSGVMKGSRLVTKYAFHFGVLTNQRKARKVVIEPNLGRPTIRQVTALTAGAKLALVRIVVLMAGATILR